MKHITHSLTRWKKNNIFLMAQFFGEHCQRTWIINSTKHREWWIRRSKWIYSGKNIDLNKQPTKNVRSTIISLFLFLHVFPSLSAIRIWNHRLFSFSFYPIYSLFFVLFFARFFLPERARITISLVYLEWEKKKRERECMIIARQRKKSLKQNEKYISQAYAHHTHICTWEQE